MSNAPSSRRLLVLSAALILGAAFASEAHADETASRNAAALRAIRATTAAPARRAAMPGQTNRTPVRSAAPAAKTTATSASKPAVRGIRGIDSMVPVGPASTNKHDNTVPVTADGRYRLTVIRLP